AGAPIVQPSSRERINWDADAVVMSWTCRSSRCKTDGSPLTRLMIQSNLPSYRESAHLIEDADRRVVLPLEIGCRTRKLRHSRAAWRTSRSDRVRRSSTAIAD